MAVDRHHFIKRQITGDLAVYDCANCWPNPSTDGGVRFRSFVVFLNPSDRPVTIWRWAPGYPIAEKIEVAAYGQYAFPCKAYGPVAIGVSDHRQVHVFWEVSAVKA